MHFLLLLRRELSPRHMLTVSCKDRGARANADYARVEVTVTDTNDHWPRWAEGGLHASVSPPYPLTYVNLLSSKA